MKLDLSSLTPEQTLAFNALDNIASKLLNADARDHGLILWKIGDEMLRHLETLGWGEAPPWRPTGPQTPDLPFGQQP